MEQNEKEGYARGAARVFTPR